MPTNCLYIVATPIGNLADISYRAIEVLSKVDLIAAEDTRHSRKLLSHYGINSKCTALHEHNELKAYQKLLTFIEQGHSVALISDAGTPLISDPGFILVQQARNQGIEVIPIPGPSALITALSVSGLASNKFSFYGFLPAKTAARIAVLQNIQALNHTVIFYESPHRIIASLTDMQQVLGLNREVCLARELTKTYETIYCAALSELLDWVKNDNNQQKGEMVVLVKGQKERAKHQISDEDINILKVLIHELGIKKAALLTAKITGTSKNALYSEALEIQKQVKNSN